MIESKYITRFWSKVKISGPNDCWIFAGGLRPNGYGNFWASGTTLAAHRIAYYLSKGEIPKDYQVCHSCDNPSCCNPNHLWIGTGKDNMHDRDRKKRNNVSHGTDRITSKLTEEIVAELRNQNRKENPLGWRAAMARKYKVSPSLIYAILKPNTYRWKHVII